MTKSYRIFKKLETFDKLTLRAFQENEGYKVSDFALLLYAKSKKEASIEDCFQLAKKKQGVISEKLLDIMVREQYFGIHDQEQRVQALRFHGFKPIDEMPKKFLREGYAYITSNSLIQGKLYIFPRRLYDDIKYKDRRTQYWQSVFEDLYLPGIIRVYYSFEYKNLKRKEMQDINQHYIGTYRIIDMGNEQRIHSTHEISSKEEFDTLMNQVILYNKNASQKRQIIKL